MHYTTRFGTHNCKIDAFRAPKQVHSSNPMASANNSLGGDLAGGGIPASVEAVAEGNEPLLTLLADPDFEESNLKHGINGARQPLAPCTGQKWAVGGAETQSAVLNR